MAKHFAISITVITVAFIYFGVDGEGYIHKLSLVLGGLLAGLLTADLMSE
jgi:hypothetical protein